MAQVINTNVMSLNSQRSLNKSQGSLATALQRLSTGLRINSAKDDAAGLAISEGMTSQIRGLNMAARNTNDGVSVVQTAEGALNEVTNMLQRMRELAIQAANGTNSVSDRAALNSEVIQLSTEINRISITANFNGSKLLDGSFSGKNIQVGADLNETIGVTIGDTQTANMGSYQMLAVGGAGAATDSTATAVNAVLAADSITITGYLGAGAAISLGISTEADAWANAINNQTTGVTATAYTKAELKMTAPTVAGSSTFTIEGVTVTAALVASDNLSQLAAAINDVTNQTNVTASAGTNAAGLAAIVLTNSSGADISITNTAGISLDMRGYQGNTTNYSAPVQAAAAGASSTVGGQLTFNSIKSFFADNSGGVAFSTADDSGVLTNSSIADVDISTVALATASLAFIDGAIGKVSSIRSDLGALQNRFESTIINLQTTSENLSAARSRIRDADFAAETAELTRTQILQQAGTAMLAQANAIPQNVLSLLG